MDQLLKIPAVIDLGPSPTVMHDKPCGPCPSTKGTDPETEDILTWPREAQMETIFRCAWRPEKLCRGYCDILKVTQADIDARKKSA